MAGLHDLELKHLIALDAVAGAGTFAKAAEKLGYTQSAISQQIASLERLLGEKVFDRPGGPRPVSLTPIGTRLLEHGRDVLRRVDATVDDLERFRSGDVGRLNIGSYQSISTHVLPEVAARLYSEHPGLELQIEESGLEDELYRLLGSGCIDLTFCTMDAVDEGFEVLHLFDDPLVLMARPGQFRPGPVPIRELADLPLIGQPYNSCQLLCEAGLRATGVEPSYVIRTADNGAVVGMVKAGMGIAVLPLLCVFRHDDGVVLHRLEPEMPQRQIGLAWRSDRTLPASARHLIEVAQQVSVGISADLATTMAGL